jgi:hypothetical protein
VDWANERYVRLYTRDTTTWRLLSWEAQAIFPVLLRLVDRAGVFDVGDVAPAEALGAALAKWPLDVVERGIDSLLKRGVIEINADNLVIPNFLEAQEAQHSAAQRQRESRAKRLAKARRGYIETEERVGPPKDERGFVYFAQVASGAVKIGCAVDIHRRISQLRTGSHEALTLIATIPDGALEADVQERFATDRIRGEWFRPSQAMWDWLQSVTTCDNPLQIDSIPSPLPSLAVPSQTTPSHAVPASVGDIGDALDELEVRETGQPVGTPTDGEIARSVELWGVRIRQRLAAVRSRYTGSANERVSACSPNLRSDEAAQNLHREVMARDRGIDGVLEVLEWAWARFATSTWNGKQREEERKRIVFAFRGSATYWTGLVAERADELAKAEVAELAAKRRGEIDRAEAERAAQARGSPAEGEVDIDAVARRLRRGRATG